MLDDFCTKAKAADWGWQCQPNDRADKVKGPFAKWCKVLFEKVFKRPHTLQGQSSKVKSSLNVNDWETFCWEKFLRSVKDLEGPEEERKALYDPDLLRSCRMQDAHLAVSTLTDGLKMDPAKNFETNRHEEVKEKCFKSKWQENPWVAVDLGTTISVGKVKLYNRLEAKGHWKLGNYPVYQELKEFPAVNNSPWVWDRLDNFQVFVLEENSPWFTWDKNNKHPVKITLGSVVDYVFDFPHDYWNNAKTLEDADYSSNLQGGSIPGAQICGGDVKKMDPWQTEFNDQQADKKAPWTTFASRNYPYIVECEGLQGRYVAVRLLNTGRTENTNTNFMNMAPLTLCEIEVEEA